MFSLLFLRTKILFSSIGSARQVVVLDGVIPPEHFSRLQEELTSLVPQLKSWGVFSCDFLMVLIWS